MNNFCHTELCMWGDEFGPEIREVTEALCEDARAELNAAGASGVFEMKPCPMLAKAYIAMYASTNPLQLEQVRQVRQRLGWETEEKPW